MSAAADRGPDHLDDVGDEPAAYELTNQDREMLELERRWWKYAGMKDNEVRERFEISITRYYQRINWLIDQPAAEAYDPQLVHRLQRLRAKRQERRSARRRGYAEN